ncbi:MAG: FTR1 family protein [Bacteroidetes bacterium]|nr:FTR1 family protein [Bacteroidota bacterium]
MNSFKQAKRIFLFFCSLQMALPLFSQEQETSRILVHTLSYISHDYQFAVQDGQVINEIEYGEAKEFGAAAVKYFHEGAPFWKGADTLVIGALIYRLDSLIGKKAAFEVVSPIAVEARGLVLAASGLKISPAKYPSLENGKTIYKANCASCHGAEGHGDGKDGAQFNPKPSDFFNEERMKVLSPFFAFNTIRLGIPGTGMGAHEKLNDNEVWDVAFYVLSLRYEKYKGASFLQSEPVKALLDTTSLEKIATTIDEEFRKRFETDKSEEAEKMLAAIRLHQPETTQSSFINITLQYLDEAMALYEQGKPKEAAQRSVLAYLEGIEPIEIHLKSSDPALASLLEKQMQQVRKSFQQERPKAEVTATLEAAKKSILTAAEILKKKEYSFEIAFFMAMGILLREGLEAFLVIMVILSIIKAAKIKYASVWVHGGWIAAVLVGVLLWMGGGALLQYQMKNIELLEGSISLLAVGMLLYIGFWLHGKSEMDKWRDYVNRMVQSALKRGSLWGLAGLSFFVVFREVFESVLFLSALNIESGALKVRLLLWGFGLLL